MHVIAKRTLREFWARHQQAESPLQAWWKVANKAEWSTPQDIKDAFRSVDFIAGNRAIFNIGGNKYRLVVKIAYVHKKIWVRFVGTHAEYDSIDPETV